jgi:hypothetical protein
MNPWPFLILVGVLSARALSDAFVVFVCALVSVYYVFQVLGYVCSKETQFLGDQLDIKSSAVVYHSQPIQEECLERIPSVAPMLKTSASSPDFIVERCGMSARSVSTKSFDQSDGSALCGSADEFDEFLQSLTEEADEELQPMVYHMLMRSSMRRISIESSPIDLHPGVPFSIQVASDLHLEMLFNNPKMREDVAQEIVDSMIVPSAPYLVLAGDIGCPGNVWGKRQYARFLEKQSEQFKLVFVLAGNHEYFSEVKGSSFIPCTAPAIHAAIKDVCSKFANVVFLDRKVAVVDGVRLIGATLWTDIAEEQESRIESSVCDYKRIYLPRGRNLTGTTRLLTARDVRIWHQTDLKFIEWQCRIAQELGQDAVILTHHCPTTKYSCDQGISCSSISSAFSSDAWDRLKKWDCIKAWVFGHTHHSIDVLEEHVRLVSNQHGYYYEKSEAYRPDFVLAL